MRGECEFGSTNQELEETRSFHCCSVAQSCLALYDTTDCSPPCPWNFPGEITGVGCHFLLQTLQCIGTNGYYFTLLLKEGFTFSTALCCPDTFIPRLKGGSPESLQDCIG